MYLLLIQQFIIYYNILVYRINDERDAIMINAICYNYYVLCNAPRNCRILFIITIIYVNVVII